MSIIVPAGKKNIVWSPVNKKATPLVKIAQTDECGNCEEVEESDPLFDAARDFADLAGKGDGAVVEVETVGGEQAEDEGKSELKDAVEEVKDAVEKMDVAVEKIEGAEEAEVEVEVGEDGPVDEVEIEVEDVPGEQEVSSGEVMVTSAPDADEGCACGKETCACAKADDKEVKESKEDEGVKEVKEASVEEEFCRFAKLSPANKKKIGDYWVNALGFPKDYVALMVKDYEK